MSNRNLKLAPFEVAPKIDWAAVDAAALADAPDDDSPQLTATDATQLRPVSELLPGLVVGKARITIHIDDAVLQAYEARAGGRGCVGIRR